MTRSDVERLALRIMDLDSHQRTELVAALAFAARRWLRVVGRCAGTEAKCLSGDCLRCEAARWADWVLEG